MEHPGPKRRCKTLEKVEREEEIRERKERTDMAAAHAAAPAAHPNSLLDVRITVLLALAQCY